MKDYSEYIRQIEVSLGKQLKRCEHEEVYGCLVLKQVPTLFSNAVVRILSPMNVHVEEDERYCTIVANAPSWEVLSAVLKQVL